MFYKCLCKKSHLLLQQLKTARRLGDKAVVDSADPTANR